VSHHQEAIVEKCVQCPENEKHCLMGYPGHIWASEIVPGPAFITGKIVFLFYMQQHTLAMLLHS
jgi:hypothetical protein